jgi:MPBQ/MSBQ methyltransferase
MKYGVSGFMKSVREVPTILLMRLAFGSGLCRFGMFQAVRNSETPINHLQEETYATTR